MNISPIILLTIGSIFAFLYASIITIGWAMTRRNRKVYHNTYGKSKLSLFDLANWNAINEKVYTVSLENNFFIDDQDNKIPVADYECFIVGIISDEYPGIKKGDLIMINPSDNKIAYSFKVPDLQHYR